MTNPQSLLGLANFIITQTVNDRQPVNNRKLNKLLFLVQGYWAAHRHQPLAAVTFKHDPAGPLETTVYLHFKFAGSFPPTSQATDVRLIGHPNNGLVLKRPMLSLANNDQTNLAKIIHDLNQLPSHHLTSLINNHSVLTNQAYTNDELIACYQAVAAIC